MSDRFTDEEWKMLHEMMQDYDRARWLRGQLKVWIMWVVGLPATIIGFIHLYDYVAKFFKGHV